MSDPVTSLLFIGFTIIVWAGLSVIGYQLSHIAKIIKESKHDR